MHNIRLVSVDLFQTLVDINSRKEAVWRQILQGDYTPERGEHCWGVASEILKTVYLQKAAAANGFTSVREIFRTCFQDAFRRLGIDFDPREAARIMAHEHARSRPFADTAPFLDAIGRRHTVCLASDTDDDMIGPLAALCDFDHIFTSQGLGTYKINATNHFFAKVLAHYGERGIQPENVIHIGDSSADVLGAGYTGIRTCWLNRKKIPWEHGVAPDYEIASLDEALALIDTDN